MRFLTFLTAFASILIAQPVVGQERLQFSSQPDSWLAPASAGIGLGGFLLGRQAAGLTPAEISGLTKTDIPSFDRWAVEFSSPSIKRASDIGLIAAVALPIIALSEFDEDATDLLLIYGETLVLTYGLTEAAKSAGRARPRAYNPDLPLSERMSSDMTKSFFSGHTSMSVAAGVFAARVYDIYKPGSQTAKILWIVGPGLGLLTGGLRVFSGMHFPTDILAGAAVGAVIGYAVPEMHRTKAYSYGIVPGRAGVPILRIQISF